MWRLLLVTFLLATFSGCSSKTDPEADVETTSTSPSVSSSSTSSTSTTVPPLPDLPFQLLLNDCAGIRSAYRYVGDAPAGPEVPPGWEEDEPRPTILHDTTIVACGRLSLGSFERGPIHVLFESHTNASVPTACLDREPATNTGYILRGLWFDDAEVAAFLAEEWSMPVHVGQFAFEETTQGGLSVFKWTWTEGGGEASEIDYGRTETMPGGNPGTRRYLWHDGASAYLMDVLMDDQRPLVTPPVAAGALRAPMEPIDPYVGVFSLLDPGATFTGTLHKFRDLQCNGP